MNIVVSGWPGAGSSTLALLISHYQKYKLLRGSETFRYIGKKLGYELTGEDRIKADLYLEQYWGPVYDKYVDYVLVNEDNLLIESDIAAFRLGLKDNIYSIFLAPTLESRQKRLIIDGRGNEAPILKKREEDLQKSYLELSGIDWLDLNLVSNKYNIVLNTSDINIAAEMEYIYDGLGIKGIEKREFARMEKEFWERGKDYYLEDLKQRNLVFSTEEIIKNIVKNFPKEINLMPPELRNIACKI